MAHLKSISMVLMAAFIFSGCYTQVHVIEERPARMTTDRYSDERAQPVTDQDIYDLGYEDGLYDAGLHFRDYDRYRWSASYHYAPRYPRYRPVSSWSFGFSYGHGFYNPYYDWAWYGHGYHPWHSFHYYSWHAPYRWHSPYHWHRYPAYGYGGWYSPFGPNYYVVYNYYNITGHQSTRVRTTRSPVATTATRASALTRDGTRTTGVRGSTAPQSVTRSGSATVDRRTNVTRSGSTAPATVRRDAGTTTRSTGSVTRNTAPTRSSGTVNRSSTPTRSSGTVNRSSTTTRSSGTVNRSSTPSRSSGTVNRSSSSSGNSGSVSRSGSTTRSSGSSGSRGRD